MTTVLMIKDGAELSVDSNTVAAHEAAGWARAEIVYGEQAMEVPYGTSVDFESGSDLKIAGVKVTPSAADINTLVGADAPAVGTLATVHPRHYQITPAAVSAIVIHAAIALAGTSQAISTGITQPDVPRTITIKGNAAGMTGNVIISGTNIEGDAITDTIALNGVSEVEGVKAFKTVTSIQVPAQTHDPDSAQEETGTVVGTISTSGNAEIIVTAAGMTNTPKTVNVSVSQGVKQAETGTVVGAVSTDGNAKVTVTAAGMTNTPKDVSVPVLAGVKQVETATAVGSITVSGNGRATVTAAGMTNSPKAVDFAVTQGVKQAETATIIGTISTSGNATVTVTADGMSNSPKAVSVAVLQGTLQVETGTVVGDIINAGYVEVIVTAAGMSGSPLTCQVYVDALDNAATVATKIRAELATHSEINAFFTIGGAGADVILTAKAKTANDATMNISIDNGTCTGLTTAATSADTTAGVAQDDAAAVGGKVRTALGLDADVSAYFDISGAGANIILTRKVEAANDATMNIASDNDTCAGLTAAATSANTTAGVAHDDASAIALAARTALGLDADVSAYFDITGAGANIILTRKAEAANDATMNVALADNTCTGITPAASSVDTTAGVAKDDASGVGGKARTALGLDADVSAYFDITGAGANIILTRKAEAANDATMNIAIDNDTCAGLTAAPTSANTTAGVAADTASGVATKIRTALGLDADVSAFFTISGTGADVILTAKTIAPNDTSMNISIGNGTAVGLTPAPTSANTTVGAYDTVSVGQAKKFGLPQIVYNAACLFIYLFNLAVDTGGTLAVDDNEVEKNLYSCAGTPNGSKVLDLYYLD